MGLSLKKITKAVTQPIKKVASVAVQTAAGFVAGGGVGAIGSAARAIHRNTQTSEAEAITLRTAGQGAATGLITATAAAAAAKGAAFVAAKGGLGAVAKSAGGKLVSLAKSKGLVTGAGNLLNSAKTLLNKKGGMELAEEPAAPEDGTSFLGEAGGFVSKKGKQLLNSPAAKDAYSQIRKSLGLPTSGTDDAARGSGNNGGVAPASAFQQAGMLGGFGSGVPTWLVVVGLVGSFIFAFYSKKGD